MLTTNSGRDTALTGAQARGDTIIATVGQDLTITSQQDTDTYKRKDTSAGIDAAIGTGGGSVSVSANQSKINSDYKSVNEQSGFEAGAGGYNITVGNHTQLNGGAIVSSADPSKNSLSTQTLGATTLDNQASYKASSIGFSASGGTSGGSFSPTMGVPHNEKESSTTRSAISDGTVDIRSGDRSSLTDISRDQTTLQIQGLVNAFDEQKVREAMELGSLAGQVGYRAAGDLADVLKFEEGSSGRAMLHALVGAGMAALGGADAASGLTSATVNQLAIPALQSVLEQFGYDKTSSEFKTLMQLGSTLIGAITGGTAGASVALSATTNNWLYHAERMALLEATKGCDVDHDQSACQEKSRLIVLSEARNRALEKACIVDRNSTSCGIELAKVQEAQRSVDNPEAREQYDSWLSKNASVFNENSRLRDMFAQVNLGHAVPEDTLRRGLCAYFGGCTTNPDLVNYPQWAKDALAGKDPNYSPDQVREAFKTLAEINSQYSQTGAWSGFTESPKEVVEYLKDVGIRAQKDYPDLYKEDPNGAVLAVIGRDAITGSISIAKNLDNVPAALKDWAIGVAKGVDSVDFGHPELSLYDVAKNSGLLGAAVYDSALNSIGTMVLRVGGKVITLSTREATHVVNRSVVNDVLGDGIPTNVYHAVLQESIAQSIMRGIDPKFFSDSSRFSGAFYLGEKSNISVAEVNFHAEKRGVTERASYLVAVEVDTSKLKVLDLTKREVAQEWNYRLVPDSDYKMEQQIAAKATAKGYTAIRYPSARAVGNNLAVLKDGLGALKLKAYTPIIEGPP